MANKLTFIERERTRQPPAGVGITSLINPICAFNFAQGISPVNLVAKSIQASWSHVGTAPELKTSGFGVGASNSAIDGAYSLYNTSRAFDSLAGVNSPVTFAFSFIGGVYVNNSSSINIIWAYGNVDNASGFYAQLNSSSQLGVRCGNTLITSPTAIVNHKKYDCVAGRDAAGNCWLWVNGQLVVSGTGATASGAASVTFSVNGDVSGNRSFGGTVLFVALGSANPVGFGKRLSKNIWNIFEPEQILLFKPEGTGPVTHPTSGDVVGNTATVTGSALREAGAQTHPSTGDVVGNTATISGTALRYRAHPTTGVVAGLTSNVTGTALRYRLHETIGAVTGLTSTVTGSATIQPAPGIHVSTGDVVAGIGSVTGSALHVGVHTTTGVLSGFSAEVIGAAQRSGAVIVHDTSGVLAGYDSVVTGAATNMGGMTLTPADIQAIVAALQAAVLPVDIVRVNHIDVDGTGADSDPWGPV